MASIKAELVSQDMNGLILHYEGYIDGIGEFIQQNRLGGLKWLRTEDKKWNIYVPYELFGRTKKFMEGVGVDFEEFKYIPKERFDASKNGINRNEYQMIDLSKINLPFEPYVFQVEDIRTLMKKTRCLIGHDMGTGKTFISVVVGESIPVPKLVIVPESLRLNWRKEILNVNPESDVKILYSKDDPNVFEYGKDWTICGYSTVAKFAKELLERMYQCVFIDEVHNCKAVNNSGRPASKRAAAVMDIALRSKYCYLLTGTPIPTRNKDLYNILRMLKVKECDWKDRSCFFQFGLKFCDGMETRFGWDFEGNSGSEELHRILARYMIRRLKKDVLPNLIKQRIFVPLETHSREYKAIEKDIINLPEGKTYMGLAMSGRAVLSKEKVNVAIDLADSLLAEGKSVVLVSNFADTVMRIREVYKDNCCMIVGGMSDSAKQKAIDDFQSGEKRVCALNIEAGGVGITFTRAHNMIIIDYDWTPALMSQVEDRICRSGQTEPCVIQYLYCENAMLDRVFVNMLTDKSANIDTVVDLTDNSMNLSAELARTYEQKKHQSDSYIHRLKDAIRKERGIVKNEHGGR